MARIKKINSSTIVQLHPYTCAPYKFLLECPFLVAHSSLNAEIKDLLSSRTFYAIEQKENNKSIFKIYAPLPHLLFWENDTPPIGTSVVLERNITNEEIEIEAWLSVFDTFLFSWDKSESYLLVELLNKLMPPAIVEKIFDRKRLNYAFLSSLNGSPRTTFQSQKRNANKTKNISSPSSKTDVLERLKKTWVKKYE